MISRLMGGRINVAILQTKRARQQLSIEHECDLLTTPTACCCLRFSTFAENSPAAIASFR